MARDYGARQVGTGWSWVLTPSVDEGHRGSDHEQACDEIGQQRVAVPEALVEPVWRARYSLRMPSNVKKGSSRGRGHGRRGGRTRISSKHQVTIPHEAFESAGLRAGDTLRVEAAGPGQVTLTRLDAVLDKYRGALSRGAITNQDIERLRDEWR